MRRSVVPSLLAALVLSLSAASAAAQDEEPEIYTNEDEPVGVVAVEVPSGAAPPSADIAVMRRDPDERPEEIASLPIENPFYELHPIDLRFSQPVTVTRILAFEQAGIGDFDPSVHGYPVASLFTRDADGVWSWLDGSTVRVDPGSLPSFAVTGRTDHGGPLFGYLGATLNVAAGDPPESVVGDVFGVEGQLHGPPGTTADIAGVSGSTSDASIAEVSHTYEVEIFDRAAGIEFACLGPGTVTYEVTFAVTGVAFTDPPQQPIDLGGAKVDVVHAGEHTCMG